MKNQRRLRTSTARRERHGGAGFRVLVILAIAGAIGVLIQYSLRLFSNPAPLASKNRQLRTGGTSVIFVVTENRWKARYAKEKKIDIVCDSAGTTAGVEGMLGKKYSVAFTHAPVSAELRERAKKAGCDVVHIPLFLCGVVPAYHVKELQGKPPLNFTGKVLADIFPGKIKQWDDAALKEINPGVPLPATKITVVHRLESSGTTQLFTEYLAAVSPEWREQAGKAAAEVKWPLGVATTRNQGVAATISENDGTIGYIDRLYTSYQDIRLDYGAVENKDKAFVRAEPDNLTAAARAILGEIPADLTFDLIDKRGKDSYPISGAIFAVCCDKQPEQIRGEIVDFLHWATHEGQADVSEAAFAPLPPELAERADERLKAITAVP